MIRMLPFLFLGGCVNAPVAPNLKLPETQKACPTLAMPPVPQKVFLQIDGDKVMSDDGGDMLLRGYVRARYLLK
jgi:hypothetical protein